MVEKMKLLHITGPKNDIDRVMGKYLSKYDIHFENAIASLSTLANVRPFVETNVYKDTYAKAKMLWEYTKEEDLSDVEKIPSKEAVHTGGGDFRETERAKAGEGEDREADGADRSVPGT